MVVSSALVDGSVASSLEVGSGVSVEVGSGVSSEVDAAQGVTTPSHMANAAERTFAILC